MCPALADHLLLANHQQDTSGVLPQFITLQHALTPAPRASRCISVAVLRVVHALLEDGKTSAICVVLLQRGPLVVAGWCQQHPPQAAVMLTCTEPQAGQVGTRCKIPTSVVDRGVNICQTLSHELLSLLGSNKGSGCGISTALALIRGTVAECLYYKFSTQIH
jgi:hypothetical protein